MSNGTELILGCILWLITCSFIFNFYDDKTQLKSKFNPPKSLNSSQQNDFLAANFKNQENVDYLKNKVHKDNLEQLQQELEFAQEKIKALSSELETRANQLELVQDESSQLETKLRQKNQEFEQKIINLETQCQKLTANLTKQAVTIKADFRNSTFSQLYSLLINYPTAKVMCQVKPNLPAQNLVALFKPLDKLLIHWHIYPIGQPWQKVNYNPQLHQPDCEDMQVGELVYIRFIGYRYHDRILHPAKVSRTLPTKKR